MFSIISNII